jgi:hypothetical protein
MVPPSIVVAKGLGLLGIGAVDHVEPKTPIAGAFTRFGEFLKVHPLLLEPQTIGNVIKGSQVAELARETGFVGVVAELCPATDVEPAARAD